MSIRYYIIFLISLFSLSTGHTQDSLMQHQQEIQLRQFDESQLESVKSDPDYNYSKDFKKPDNLWNRFGYWLRSWLSRFFAGSFANDILPYILAILAIAFLAYHFYSGALQRTFYHTSRIDPLNARTEEAELMESNLSELITNAEQKAHYRLAIRYLFLQTLKKLSKKDLIQWDSTKTNQEYLDMIKNAQLQSHVHELMDVFEYVWYGELEIDRLTYQQLKVPFLQISGKVEMANV